jgi:hypothetical protein
MTADRARLLHLIDRLEAGLKELRKAVQEHAAQDDARAERSRERTVEAFADEAFRARDA